MRICQIVIALLLKKALFGGLLKKRCTLYIHIRWVRGTTNISKKIFTNNRLRALDIVLELDGIIHAALLNILNTFKVRQLLAHFLHINYLFIGYLQINFVFFFWLPIGTQAFSQCSVVVVSASLAFSISIRFIFI